MKETTLKFLFDLRENNDREWFRENKMRYEDARRDVEGLTEYLIPAIRSFDPLIASLTAKECMFRIYRDIRFSKDKTPYKSYFGVYIAPGGRKSLMCGYYLHLEPGNCLLAGGAYRPPAEYLKEIRFEIYHHLEEFEEILSERAFKHYFGQITGDRLKRPPKGFPADFEGLDYLKMKDFVALHKMDEKLIATPGFAEHILRVFRAVKPLNDFFNRVLKTIEKE